MATVSRAARMTGAASLACRAEHPDKFFSRVRICLQASDLSKALEIIQSGNPSIHRNLVPGNIEMITTFLSVNKETSEKTSEVRCSRLTKVMQEHFPDVFQLEAVKKKGAEAGLSMDEVEQSLSQVVMKDGSFWVIGSTHNDKYEAWENSLIGMAGSNKINLWSEGTVRNSTMEATLVYAKTRGQITASGQFRGLENWETMQCVILLRTYLHFFETGEIGMIAQYPFLSQVFEDYYACKLAQYLKLASVSRDLFFISESEGTNLFSGTLAETVKASNKDPIFVNMLKAQMSLPFYDDGTSNDNCLTYASELVKEEGDLRRWVSFFEETLLNALKNCSNCPKAVQESFQELAASAKKYQAMFKQVHLSIIQPKTHEELRKFAKMVASTISGPVEKAARESGFLDAREKFLAAFRPVRDEVFANTFFSDWPNRNKDAISLVMFGSNHKLGFKKAVVAHQDGKAESKEKKNDEKADHKEGSK